jgi:hypothetical protein
MGRILLAEAETCSASAARNLFAQYKLPVAKTYPILNTFLPPPPLLKLSWEMKKSKQRIDRYLKSFRQHV